MKWYQIQNKKNDDEATILIYEQIGQDFFGEGVSAKQFVEELNALEVGNINLHINSPGGSVFDGNAIYNALKAHKAKIRVKVDGIAASIASVVAMSGDVVEMPENAMMMIHDPSAIVIGTAEDMKKMSDTLGKLKSGLIVAYQGKTGMNDSKLSDMMTDETWITAKEAVKMGFADMITEKVTIQAKMKDLSNFKNVPKCLIETITAGKPPGTNEKGEQKMEITLELIRNDHPEIAKALINEGKEAGLNEGQEAGRKEGAEVERDRIKAVQEQTLPGHEDLIETLKFDGVTTGAEAAVKVLQAEKVLQAKVITDHVDDAPEPVDDVPTDELAPADSHLSVEDRCKAEWEKNPKVRAEFMDDFDSYVAAEKALASGNAKILKPGEKD